MTDQPLPGTTVLNPAKPEWGPGRVVKVQNGKVYVFFRDEPHRRAKRFNAGALEIAPEQSDVVLDHLPPFEEVGGYPELPAERVTAHQARENFVDLFPAAFADPAYVSGERDYKLRAHELYAHTLGNDQLNSLLQEGNVEEVTTRATRAIGRVNLLHAVEATAFKQGLSNPGAAREYFARLDTLLKAGPTRSALEDYLIAVTALPTTGSMDTEKWTIATILPFLAQPQEFMFLKPMITKAAAERLGFDLEYVPQPNWSTYNALMTMSRLYLERLRDLGARDFIDVQSFFWITSEQFA